MHTVTDKFILFLLILAPCLSSGQSLIIDHHAVSVFDSIPEAYKQAAENLRMLFMDRSVGFNISTYLDCLSQPWDSAPSSCKRYNHMDSLYAVDPAEVYWNGTWDRSNWRYEFWPTNCSEDVNCFIDFIDDRLDSFDVIGCQFSYLAVLPGSNIADRVSGFFGNQGNDNKASSYAAFANAHPDKTVIWWTTSLARGIGTHESESFNDQMRDYAVTQDIVLFDVADILSHDPSGTPCYDNRDGVTYRDENHPDDGLDIPAICPQYTTETEGGHLGSISAGGIRVSKAFWVLMARLAGWEGGITSIKNEDQTFFRLYPNPATEIVYLETTHAALLDECAIFDVHGRMHARECCQLAAQKESLVISIPLKDLSAGVYCVQVRMGEEVIVKKLIVY